MAKKKTADLFGDDDISEKRNLEFERLLDGHASGKILPGDTFQAEILSIGDQDAFVATGTPIDGAMSVRDLHDGEGQLQFKVGDVIEVKVVRANDNEVLVRRLGATNYSAEVDDLREAFESKIAVQGRVVAIVKGGFKVEIEGTQAFCPISQIDFKTDMPEEYLNKNFLFLITKYEQGGRNLVVSRRQVLDQQKKEAENDFLSKHKKGDLFQGKITRIEKFGAFVEVHGVVQGLIPISELAWSRVSDPHDIVTIGQTVQVMLLEATPWEGRLKASFSLKQGGGEGDPWLRVVNDFSVGKSFEGVVERKEPFGLFVTIIPGVTGLLPKSKWADHADSQTYDRKKKGDKVRVQIDEIRAAEKKIALAPPSEKEDLSGKAMASSNSAQGFGTLGDLFKKSK